MSEWTWMDGMSRDVRHALGALARSPAFTLVALLSLALGLGANTAIFSIVHAVMLRSLPVQNPEQLVQLSIGDRQTVVTNPIWEEIRDGQRALDGVLAYSRTRFDAASGAEPRHVEGLYVSGGYFRTLGLIPAAGRLIVPEDDVRGGGRDGPVAVLGHDYWRDTYKSSFGVIGSAIRLDGHPFTIVGVAPAGFFGVSVGQRFDVAVPLAAEALVGGRASMLDRRTSWWLTVLGRLKAGGSRQQAEAELRALAPRIREATMPFEYVWEEQRARYLSEPFSLGPAAAGSSSLRSRYRTALLTLTTVVAIVLLIACANLANLLLARASARRRQFAVRLALGASRAQLVRQQLVECLVLALGGAALGILFARWAGQVIIRQMSSTQMPLFLDLSLDWRVLGFSIALAAASALTFGLAPALRSTDARATDLLRAGTRSSAAGWRGLGLEKLLVVVQIAFSLVLVVGAGLFVRSFAGLARLDPGFDPSQLLVVSVDARRAGDPPERRRAEIRRVVESLRQLPGVRSAAPAVLVPITRNSWTSTARAGSRTPATKRVFVNRVGPRYFATLGTPLHAGRDFGPQDAPQAPPVAIVNEAFARTFFGGANALGSTFEMGETSDTPVRIVGIVKDSKYIDLRQTVPETVYLAIDQNPEPTSHFSVIVRGTADVAREARSLAAAVRDVNEDFAIDLRVFDTIVEESMIQERLLAMLSSFFGALALAVAAIGLYGVMSLAVSRRRNEIGVRLALGARPSSVAGMVLRDVAAVTMAGLAIGAASAALSGRLIGALLFGLQPGDATTWVLAVATLGMAAALAGYLPARRASRLDPLIALRDE